MWSNLRNMNTLQEFVTCVVEIEKHRPLCPNVDKVCPFAELGCDYIGDKITVQQHLTEEPIRHLMFLCDEVTDLKEAHREQSAQNKGTSGCQAVL
ncbi:hypothetical protein OSTOST_23520 [Ostertagia ostertagi]